MVYTYISRYCIISLCIILLAYNLSHAYFIDASMIFMLYLYIMLFIVSFVFHLVLATICFSFLFFFSDSLYVKPYLSFFHIFHYVFHKKIAFINEVCVWKLFINSLEKENPNVPWLPFRILYFTYVDSFNGIKSCLYNICFCEIDHFSQNC